MFECEQCGGRGYVSYVAFYCGNKVTDDRACDCLERFLKAATPHEIIDYIKYKVSGSKAQRCQLKTDDSILSVEITLKKQYNEKIKRWKAYEDFVNDKNISDEKKLKYIEQSQELVNGLSETLNEIKKLGITCTETELLSGFELNNCGGAG